MTLTIISLIFSGLAIGCCVLNMILNKKVWSQIKLPQINQITDVEENTLVNDILSYAFDKELKCMAMPGLKDQLTLFAQDEDGNSYPICKLFSTPEPKGSESYNTSLKVLTDQVDSFISNNKMQILKAKLKEENSAKSE